ncbi:MAG: helix-turn-helix transcriptional regulator [Pseudomonadota bacterium]
MTTPLGKFLRKERIEREWTLRDMAKLLDISSSYLSHIEMGKRPIPSEIISQIINELNLTEEKQHELIEASKISHKPKIIKINREELSNYDADLALMFARNFENLEDDKKNILRRILEDSEEEDE